MSERTRFNGTLKDVQNSKVRLKAAALGGKFAKILTEWSSYSSGDHDSNDTASTAAAIDQWHSDDPEDWRFEGLT